MSTTKLSEKEFNLFTLYLVKECVNFAETNEKTFEEVLNEDVFANTADTYFAESVCKSLLALKNAGYIDGNIELEYEIEIEPDSFEEETIEAIDFSLCTFENISITAKGKVWLSIDGLKDAGDEFIRKVKPVIKCIAETALQTAVEVAITTGMKAIGFKG